MQTHRHFEDLWAATRRLLDEAPDTHVVVVGRGTNQLKVGMEPVAALGMADRVHFPGYMDGENYVAALAAFDVGVYLVPGSDGTCRAAREIMAMGKPMVVADRGMLAEIVSHEANGLVFDGSVDGLHAALRALVADPSLRARMGAAARARATAAYSLEAQAQAVREVYEAVLAAGGRR
jgi:glycosyltransferase involved in cell wall biosynthesis